ncbi:hypothetical protein BLSTO_05644 [Blastocystis sp. subtype 1]
MSKRIIFSYLEDIKNTFIAYLQNENKEESCRSSLFTYSWRTALATMARPYAYARFDREIQMKRKQYDQQGSNTDSYGQINESLIDIQNIMRKNINEVVQRVEKIECIDVTSASEKMIDDSKKFKWGAKKLNYVVRPCLFVST